MIVRYLKRTGSEVWETDGEAGVEPLDGRRFDGNVGSPRPRAGFSPKGFRFLLRLSLEPEGKPDTRRPDPRTGRVIAENAKTLSGRPGSGARPCAGYH